MTASPYLKALAIGAASGSRTFAGPATTLRLVNSPWAGFVAALACGECLADKLPQAPSRLQPLGLIARVVAGALCGGAIAKRAGGGTRVGAGLGIVGAVASAYGLFGLRRSFTVGRGLPDFPIALAEDAAAFLVARTAAR